MSVVEFRIDRRPYAFGVEEGSGKQVYVAAQVVSWVQGQTGLLTGLFRVTGKTVRNKRSESGVPLAMLERGVESVEVVEDGVRTVEREEVTVTGRYAQVAVLIPSKKNRDDAWGADYLKGWCRNGDEVFISREPAIEAINLNLGRPGVIAINAVLWRNRGARKGGAKWHIGKVEQVVERLSFDEERDVIRAAGIGRGRDFY